MPPDGSDRRQAVRRTPQPDESLARVRLRTGRELAVVDISSTGALVEGLTRLLPGTRAEVHVVTRQGRVLVRTRVVRALVWQLRSDLVCYRTALAFDSPVDINIEEYSLPAKTPAIDGGAGSLYPSAEVESHV
jgi:hypothetical protein